MRGFGDIPRRLLGPLDGKGDDVWHAGPPGAWSPGEIVAHVATSIAVTADVLDSRRDKPPMRRRRRPPIQLLLRPVILGIGWFPVRRQAPAFALPETHPDRAGTEARLREAVTRFERLAGDLLPRRRGDLYVKHPVLGDLTLEEWMRFHVVHTEHHRRQLIRRMRGQ